MDLHLNCHAKKAVFRKDSPPAVISITATCPDLNESVSQEFTVNPTINWVPGSTAEGSETVTIAMPNQWFGKTQQWSIAVADNDLLICGYSIPNWEIVTNPLWDGEPGPYDITGHRPGGGTMGNGSLGILAGQTVTFDAAWGAN